MAVEDHQNKTDSPKAEVGEIDTRAPFQSVKDAINLFGEGAFSGEKITIKKTKPHSAERLLVKETKLQLAQKELYKLKERLKSAEITKTGALTELEQAKKTVDDLTKKLEAANEAKEAAIKASMNQSKQFERGVTDTNDGTKQDLQNTRLQYAAVFTELDAAKQELRRIRHDCETVEKQNDGIKQETESELIKNVNLDRASEISEDIMSSQETISDKNVQKLAHKAALKESATKLLALQERVNPEKSKDVETQSAEAPSKIKSLQMEMGNARVLDHDSLKTVTLDLDCAKDSLHKVVEEESSLKKLLESLKIELENIKKEHKELKEKETVTESVSVEMMLTFRWLISENENARQESEEMKEKSEELKKEAETTKLALEETESKLKIALMEADEAKKAESKAINDIKAISERADAASASTSVSKIMISREVEALRRKRAEMKLEATQKEVDDLRAETVAALKRAEAAETCKKEVECELRRWKEREQKKTADAVALMLEETQMQRTPSLPSTPNRKQSPLTKQKMKKVFSGIFHRKKLQPDVGSSASYLPGEKPV